MLILTDSLSLEVLLAAAPTTQCDIVSSFADYSDEYYAPGQNNTLTNGLHAVEAVQPAPLASEVKADLTAPIKRLIDTISIYNPNATAVTVTVRIRDKTKNEPNTSAYTTILSTSLASGRTLQYTHSSGWS